MNGEPARSFGSLAIIRANNQPSLIVQNGLLPFPKANKIKDVGHCKWYPRASLFGREIESLVSGSSRIVSRGLMLESSNFSLFRLA